MGEFQQDRVELKMVIEGRWASAFGLAPVARRALERAIGRAIFGTMRGIGNYDVDQEYQVTLTPIEEENSPRMAEGAEAGLEEKRQPNWRGYVLWLLGEIARRLDQVHSELSSWGEANDGEGRKR